jgi:hypothetical protein
MRRALAMSGQRCLGSSCGSGRKTTGAAAPAVGTAFLNLLLLPAPTLNPDDGVPPSYWHELLGGWKELRSECAIVFGAFGFVLSQNRENVLWACGMM